MTPEAFTAGMPGAPLLFGATSMVGYGLTRLFPDVHAFAPPGRANAWSALHLDDPAWLRTLFSEQEPRLLIYCHAVCDVAKCEQNPDWAHDINVGHVRRLVDALPVTTRLVYVSSDHVFGGNGTYSEDDMPCPISVYGQTRVAAETLVLARPRSLALRAGLAIGPSHNGRTGYCDWLNYRHHRKLPITIVDDEVRSAIWVDDLGSRIMQLALGGEIGLRHLCATQVVSRVQLARFLGNHLNIPLVFDTASRHQQSAPHLGHVELTTIHKGELHQALPSVLPCDAWRETPGVASNLDPFEPPGM